MAISPFLSPLGSLFGSGGNNAGGGSETLFGTPEQMQQFPLYAQPQQQAFSQILQQALQGLQNQDYTQGFEPFAQNARRQFETETVPSLAERFTAMGGDSRPSRNFTGALGAAGSNLDAQLEGLRSQYGLQNKAQDRQHFTNLLGLGLTPQFGQKQVPGMQGILPQLLSLLGGAAGAFGGPVGAGIGAQLGSGLGQIGASYGQQQNAQQQPLQKLSAQSLMDNNALMGAQNMNMAKRLGGGY